MRIIEAMDFESDTKNWKYSFKRMTKQYGREFIDTLRAMWFGNENTQTEDEFCEMNGIPKAFFIGVIKDKYEC